MTDFDDGPVTIAVPETKLRSLILAAHACADELAQEFAEKYPSRETHVVQSRRYARDMTVVDELRAAIQAVWLDEKFGPLP